MDSNEDIEVKSNKRQKNNKSLYSLPTLDEQKQINLTNQLLKENYLLLQINELLNEVKLNKKPKYIQDLDTLINTIKEILMKSKKYDNKNVNNAFISDNNVPIELSNYSDIPINLQYHKPVDVGLVGSYPTNTITSPYINIDINVTIPSECIDERDILNYIYFDKKALYLSVCYHLLQSSLKIPIEIRYFKSDIRKPHIVICPQLKGWKDLEIRIIPTISTDIFKVVQLNSLKNNIRPKEWLETLKLSKEMNDSVNNKLDVNTLLPTPNYNNSIAEDMAITLENKILLEMYKINPITKDLGILFKIWLTQRGLRYGFDSFDSHSSSLLIAYILQLKLINQSMNVLTSFQILIKFIKDLQYPSILNFNSTTIQPNNDMNAPFLQLLHPLGNIDKYIDYNCLWRINRTSFQILKSECSKTLELLQSNDDNIFNRIFILKYNILNYNDIFYHIPLAHNQNHYYDQQYWNEYINKFYHTLMRALNDRVNSISIYVNKNTTVITNYNSNIKNCQYIVTIGLTLNIQKAIRKVDRGPTYDQTEELNSFRHFWGEKCQLRRFQDGSIVEAIVWDNKYVNNNIYLRSLYIVNDVLNYILKLHYKENILNIQSISLLYEQYQYNKLIQYTSGSTSNDSNYDYFLNSNLLNSSLDKLRTILTSTIKYNPINIESINGIDNELRYTSIYIPMKHPLLLSKSTNIVNEYQNKKISLFVKPILLIGKLEISSKWPSDLAAINKLKLAILLKLIELLRSQFEITSIIQEDSLDIIYEGYLFRLMLLSDPEVSVASTYIPNTPSINYFHPSNLLRLCNHNQAIRAIASNYACFPDTVRYFSIWLSENFLSGLLSQDVIELLILSVFITTNPPSSTLNAFLLTINLLMTFDFKANPLVIDYNQTMTTADKTAISNNFSVYRKTNSHLPIYIITSYNYIMADKKKCYLPVIWEYDISNPEFNIIKNCCNYSYNKLINYFISYNEINDNQIDILSANLFNNCNVIMKFQNELVKTTSTINNISLSVSTITIYKNTPYNKMSLKNLIVRWTNSNHYFVQEEIIKKLRYQFSDIALFFYNSMYADQIGIVWKPLAFLPKKLSVLDSVYRLPIMVDNEDIESDITVLNVNEILSNILTICDSHIISLQII